ncbi:DICT sensory domain-containing protein [Kamptonema animale CS-326]|jgi:DICT domain-containing protein/signal transduction histidine kinase|uniref:DICT sensory domain-containing protein n=1 Tax=Kamptonema animale TaxID=92934 RepID=UPI00232C2D16|nr:DICT sensory domain-containing protein [Kamptonema animale]MDB9510206.1 DICT sensory domain-containing protein [Kamptonema animale CS-326]
MIVPTSVLPELLQALPQLRSQIYFKSSLTALSHAMEDLVLAGLDQPLVIASFQRERFYRQEAHRYRRIATLTSQVYVLAVPETDFKNASDCYETVAFKPEDGLSQEWHLVVIGQEYSTCLICQERKAPTQNGNDSAPLAMMDQARRFEGIWTFDREVSCKAADLLLKRILNYRPELEQKIEEAQNIYGIAKELPKQRKTTNAKSKSALRKGGQNPKLNEPFAQRLVTYLQAGQHKLLKAYRSIAAQERKERLVNLITTAMRRSLNHDEMIEVAVQELGEALHACRCLIYRCKATDAAAKINQEFLRPGVRSLRGQTWPLQNNPMFEEVVSKLEPVYVEQGAEYPLIANTSALRTLVQQWQILSWLMVPVLYQGRVLGIVELHQCYSTKAWEEDELALVEAIATQLGAALIQAETYAHLEELNQQLEALDRTRSNLIAITGHELRTPLSTIQVCLESLSQDPDMPLELRQVMLETALSDAERMRKLVQDFLTLSHLESGRVQWNMESLPLQECVDLALSSIRARRQREDLPQIIAQVPPELPLVQADGEWLVEVLSKLLDNACKFTEPKGTVTIEAKRNGDRTIEVVVTDTGRGIEPNRLEVVFDRFYQEEGALRRSTGGTGLGLAICRQIVRSWGGQIWANSAGKDRGSQFHFTIPFVENGIEPKRS